MIGRSAEGRFLAGQDSVAGRRAVQPGDAEGASSGTAAGKFRGKNGPGPPWPLRTDLRGKSGSGRGRHVSRDRSGGSWRNAYAAAGAGSGFGAKPWPMRSTTAPMKHSVSPVKPKIMPAIHAAPSHNAAAKSSTLL